MATVSERQTRLTTASRNTKPLHARHLPCTAVLQQSYSSATAELVFPLFGEPNKKQTALSKVLFVNMN